MGSQTRQYLKLAILLALTAAVLAALLPPGGSLLRVPDPLFAIGANFAMSGWIVFLHKLLRIPPVRRYYITSTAECRRYEWLGVRQFKTLVSLKPYRWIWGPAAQRSSGGKIALKDLLQDMRAAETAHLVAFALMALIIAFAALGGRPWLAAWLTFFDVIINGYPVMLQRYNRHRIRRILRREALAAHISSSPHRATSRAT